MGLVVISLVGSSIEFTSKLTKRAIIGIFGLLLCYLLGGRFYIGDIWAYLIVPISFGVIYLTVYRPNFIKPPRKWLIVSSVMLISTSSFHYVQIILQAEADKNLAIGGGLVLMHGLLIIVTGSVITFMTALWSNKYVASNNSLS